METRKITLRDLLTVTGEIECESAKKYLSKDILDDEVEIVEGVCSKGVKITMKREDL